MKKKVVGIIPARYASTRLPGKPLKDICGKPMIWWVYQRVIGVNGVNEVYVATDDNRISEVCNVFNIPVIMTKNTHMAAAHRLQEVSTKISADFYLQLNGDEPLINQAVIAKAIPDVVPQDVAYGTNIITKMHTPSEVMDASNIKVVFDDKLNALYMSRTPIPYPFKSIQFDYYKHVGIIGYNKKMLDFYTKSNQGRFEIIEGIDTLRFIDYGKQLQFIEVDQCESLSVDTQQDLDKVRLIIQEKIKKGELSYGKL